MQITRPTILPENWPSSVPYLTSPLYSPGLTHSHLCNLRTRPTDQADLLEDLPASYKPGPRAHVRITPITDPRHPACRQAGLFAARDLRPGELIVVYMGEIHVGNTKSASSSKESGEQPSSPPTAEENPHAHSDYDLWLDREGDLAIDAAHAGNEARFVNDSRGVPVSPMAAWRRGDTGKKGGEKSKPNAEFRTVWDAQRGEKVMAVFVLPAGKRAAGRAKALGVAKGEEILVSYGRGFWGERKAEGGEWEKNEWEEAGEGQYDGILGK